MSDRFFDRPILNSPYEYPSRHWELDESGQPTSHILDRRRRVSFITPIPRPKKRGQHEMVFDAAAQALETRGSAVRADGGHQRAAAPGRRVAFDSGHRAGGG